MIDDIEDYDYHEDMLHNDYEHWLRGASYGRPNEVMDTDIARIKYIERGCYINHPCSDKVVKELEGLMFAQPKGFFGHIAIVGPKGSGKTMTHSILKNGIGRSYIGHDININMSILEILLPEMVTEHKLLISLINSFCQPYSLNDSLIKLRTNAIHLLLELKVKVLVIENTEVLLNSSPSEIRSIMSALSFLSEHTNLSLVIVMQPEVYKRVKDSQALFINMSVVYTEDFKNDNEFRKLLKSFEMFLPLKQPSTLNSPELSNAIFSETKGNIGAVFNLLQKSAIFAIKSGQERITINHINDLPL